MNKKLFFYLFIVIAFVSCKNDSVRISGTLLNPIKGEYIFLDELKSNELKTADSMKVSENGTFDFRKEIKSPSFYLIKINEKDFLTMLIAPGEKIIVNAYHDSLNYPISISGSKGTESMAEYNNALRKTINKLSGLNKIYSQNVDNPNLHAVMDSLDNLAQNYLNEINSYTKTYIDNNITSLVSLVALYQQVAPKVYVLNPTKDKNILLRLIHPCLFYIPIMSRLLLSIHRFRNLLCTSKGRQILLLLQEKGLLLPKLHFQHLKVILSDSPQQEVQWYYSISGHHGALPADLRTPILLKHLTSMARKDLRFFRFLSTKPERHG